MTVDARSLGFGRIVLALILLFDLWHRARVITLFYSNDGLIPNHMMLWRPPTQWMFSFFFILSRPDEVAVGFALCGLIYLVLLVGWRTRLMQVLSRDRRDEPAQPRDAARERRRLDAGRADAVDGVPAAREAVLRRRGARQPARAARDDGGRARRPQGDGRVRQRDRRVAGRARAGAARSRTPTSSTRFTRAGRRGGRGRRCTT